MARSGPAPLPPESSSRFRHLLDPLREAVGAATALEEIHDALAELRRVQSQAEAKRLLLVLADSARLVTDSTLDSKQLAAYLNVTPDWLNRHRHEYQSAQVNPAGTRPRYSKVEVNKLRQRRRSK